MRILVTGRDGQVARSLAERNVGHELIFAGRPDFDLMDSSTIEREVVRIAPDLIVSAAAYTAVDRAEDDADAAMRANGDAPGVLARAAARIEAPIIHLSTDYVFDGQLDRPYCEDDVVCPLSVYGVSKLAGEDAIASSGAQYAILRTAWVYSPFGANFVKTMLRLAGERQMLQVVEDQRGCPTSALDIADAIGVVIAAWRCKAQQGTGAVYHVAGTGETSWADFARAIFAQSAALGGPSCAVTGIPTSGFPTRARRPRNSRLDCRKFEATFDYRAPPWQESLAPVVRKLIG